MELLVHIQGIKREVKARIRVSFGTNALKALKVMAIKDSRRLKFADIDEIGAVAV